MKKRKKYPSDRIYDLLLEVMALIVKNYSDTPEYASMKQGMTAVTKNISDIRDKEVSGETMVIN